MLQLGTSVAPESPARGEVINQIFVAESGAANARTALGRMLALPRTTTTLN